ncbi:MAG: hypothetical protein U0946_05605, partial [Patescibacteria group bacterium]|nr:hypothetical protein [Patescibacteria group bacterium]
YWAPQISGQSGGRWSGWIGLRWFVTNFANDPYWNSNFNGSFAAKTYCVVGQTPINNVCPSPTGNFTSLFKEFGEVIQNTTLISTTDTQHNYFAPYFLGPRYLPNRPSVFYEFDRKDKLHVSGLESTLCNTIPTTYQYNDRIWHLDISNTTVNTPAYTGPALRYRFLEGILPQGGVISTILREDWFLTKDIGVVRIDQVPAISLSGGPLNTYDKFLASCRANSACLGNNNNIVSPNSSMSLTSFFDISQTPLIPSANTEGTTTITVGQNQNWNLLVKTRNNTLYTGWIDLQSPNTKKWQWIENGTLTIQESGTIGSYTYRIRPNLKETPSQYETKIGSNNLPWSRIIIINVITLPIGTITGPTSVRKNTAAAYTATANSIVNNLQKVEIYATSINSQQWQLLGRKTNCSGYICTLTVNWTPTQTGLYYIVLNAYNQNGQRCSGNVNPNSACQYFIKDLWNVCHSNSWNQCDPESEDIILVDVIP